VLLLSYLGLDLWDSSTYMMVCISRRDGDARKRKSRESFGRALTSTNPNHSSKASHKAWEAENLFKDKCSAMVK
jgi:hypothetical protein